MISRCTTVGPGRLYLVRKLTEGQLQQAHDLGAKMARAIAAGNLEAQPVVPPAVNAVVSVYSLFRRFHEIADT